MEGAGTHPDAGAMRLEIEAIETAASSVGTVIVRVAARWPAARPLPGSAARLIIGDGPARRVVAALAGPSQIAERAAGDERALRAVFSVQGSVDGALALRVGTGSTPLPRASGSPGHPGDGPPDGAGGATAAGEEGTVIDRAVLAERRARRAEESERGLRERADAAERAASTLEIEITDLTLRLEPGAAATSTPATPIVVPSEDRPAAGVAPMAGAPAGVDRDLLAAESALARRSVRRRAPVAAPRLAAVPLRDLVAREQRLALRHATASGPVQGHAMAPARGRGAGSVAEALDRLDRERRAAPETRRTLEQRERELSALRSELERATADLQACDLTSQAAVTAAAALESAERRIGEARTAALEAQRGLARERAERTAAEAELRAEIEIERGRASAAENVRTAVAEHPGGGPVAAPSPDVVPVVPAGPGAAAPAARPAPWLPEALASLAAADPVAAMGLALSLLPAAGIGATRTHRVDLELTGLGWHHVDIAPGGAEVTPAAERRPRRDTAARVTLDGPTLITLITSGPSRQVRRAARVRGTWRRRRALRLLGPLELDLAVLAAASVRPDPELLFAALARRIEPGWTRGHRFTVRQTVTGAPDRSFTVIVDDDRPVRVRRPDGEHSAPPQAAVVASAAAFQRLLAAQAHPHDDRPALSGDPLALGLLARWTRWAQDIGCPQADAAAPAGGHSTAAS